MGIVIESIVSFHLRFTHHMSWSREEALTDPGIREPLIFLSEFRFSLRDIPVEIAVRLYRPLHSDKIVVRRSHDIVVEGLNAEQAAKCENEDREGEVLHAAVDELLCVYNAARAQGLTPDTSWLKRSADFS
ncbi:MAG: hypothetical protein QOI22_1111 [Verrucomicrobiota bacterium]